MLSIGCPPDASLGDGILRLAMEQPLGVAPRPETPVPGRRRARALYAYAVAGLEHSLPPIGELPGSPHSPLSPLDSASPPAPAPIFAPGPYPFCPPDFLAPGAGAPFLRLAPLAPSALDPRGPPLGPVEPVLLPPLHAATSRPRPRLVPFFPVCSKDGESDDDSRPPTPPAKRRRADPVSGVPPSNPGGPFFAGAEAKHALAAPELDSLTALEQQQLASLGFRPLRNSSPVDPVLQLEPAVRRLRSPAEQSLAGAELESTMTMEQLSPLFSSSSTDAAARLGISTTRLKRISRSLGVTRWPFRKIAALDRWSLTVRAAGLLQRARRAETIGSFDEAALLEEVRRTKEAVVARPNGSVHAVVKRLNKALLERPAKRAGRSSVEWGRRLLLEGAELAGAAGDAALREALLAAVAADEREAGRGGLEEEGEEDGEGL